MTPEQLETIAKAAASGDYWQIALAILLAIPAILGAFVKFAPKIKFGLEDGTIKAIARESVKAQMELALNSEYQQKIREALLASLGTNKKEGGNNNAPPQNAPPIEEDGAISSEEISPPEKKEGRRIHHGPGAPVPLSDVVYSAGSHPRHEI